MHMMRLNRMQGASGRRVLRRQPPRRASQRSDDQQQRHGWIRGWSVLAAVGAAFTAMGWLMFTHRELTGELAFGGVHM